MRVSRLVVVLAFGLSSLGVHSALATTPAVVRVRTSTELQAAFRSVPDGGVIELAAGTYASPNSGFSLGNLRKAFTVRAAEGAVVALDGQGRRAVLRFKNADRSRGKRVTFQDIIFQNGLTTSGTDAGGVTLVAAEARFERCSFQRNASQTTGGGALRLFSNSAATAVTSSFRNNSSARNGGAIAVVGSALTLLRGDLTDNRTNLPGHNVHSSGGAIHIVDGTARITDIHFERNEAGWTGGAIYAFGTWTDPVTTPKSDVTIVRSTFIANRAVPDPCCGVAEPTSGGAIHIEDQSTLRLYASQLFDNVADFGGAIDNFRGEIEMSGSELRRNQAPAIPGRIGVGGAISMMSNDSNNDYGINRRTARLVASDSLFQGGTPPPAVAANTGGCLAAEGDWTRQYGIGMPAAGTPAENRARVELRRVAFADCDVEKVAAGGGLGGGVVGTLIDLILDSCLVIDSDARGDGAGGGGLALQRESAAVISGTTFAQDTAEKWGGAVFVGGSTVQIASCRFLRNEVSPGVSEGINESRGASIFTIPQLGTFGARNVGGQVTGSLFSEDRGISIFDLVPVSGPANTMRYGNNQFYPTWFGDRAYINTQLAPGGLDPFSLNALPVSDGGNLRLFGLPRDGALVAAPAGLGAGAPASPVSFLAYAWSGHGASISGQPLGARTGLFATNAVGSHSLTVDGAAVATAQLAASACTAGPAICQRRGSSQAP
jgi:predicted outer membrane repeat protein